MGFDDLKLRTKILIPLTGMAILFGGVIAVGTVKLGGLTNRYSQIASHVDPAMLTSARAVRTANNVVREAYGLLNYDPAGEWAKKVAADFAGAKASGDKQWDEAIRLNPSAASKYQTFKDRFDAICDEGKAPAAIGAAIPALNIGSRLKPAELDQMATAMKELETMDKDVTALADDVQTYNAPIEQQNRDEVDALKRDATNTTLMMIGLGLISILGGLGLSIWMASAKVAGPLVRLGERMKELANGDLTVTVDNQDRSDEVGSMAKAVQVFKENGLKARAADEEAARLRADAEAERTRGDAERRKTEAEQATVVKTLATSLSQLAQGDLTTRIDADFQGQYAQIKSDFNAASSSLCDAVGAIVAATGGIRSGSNEIATASDDMSRRTEQQAASLEETAAALDEITATVRKTADGAKEARDVVVSAKGGAESGGQVVSQAMTAMSEIESSAQQISQIISVIDEIAFQTNLLALNAGVEAARAGDAGKGFAVVASEVRALAQRSADAAKEIKGLISDSTAKVGQGVKLVGETGQALERIVEEVGRINTLVSEIALAAQEQAAGLAQVNVAVNQMDQVTQQNAAMVEQTTAASGSLRGEAEELGKLVTRFRTGADETDGNPVRGAQRKIAQMLTTNQAKPANWSEF